MIFVDKREAPEVIGWVIVIVHGGWLVPVSDEEMDKVPGRRGQTRDGCWKRMGAISLA